MPHGLYPPRTYHSNLCRRSDFDYHLNKHHLHSVFTSPSTYKAGDTGELIGCQVNDQHLRPAIIPSILPPMPAYGPRHQQACDFQGVLAKEIENGCKPLERVRMIECWMSLENFKRALRGIPPLAPHKLSDLPLRRANRSRQLRPPAESTATDVTPTKESLSPPTP